MAEQELLPCPLKHHVSAGLRVSKIDPRITCLDCGLILMATDWVTLHERWQARATTSDYRQGVEDAAREAEKMYTGYGSIIPVRVAETIRRALLTTEQVQGAPTHRCNGVNGAERHGTQNKCTVCGEYRNGWYDTNGMEIRVPAPPVPVTADEERDAKS